MTGRFAKSFAGAALVGGLAASGGCTEQGKVIDPCYPERYVATARQAVHSAFTPQVQNGHILDQTVWNYHFETGKDELNNGGKDHLDSLSRRRPCPDARVYLATARDVAYDPLNPDKMVEGRRDLDERRVAAIQKYLNAQTAGRPMAFEVVVHDPAEVGQHAAPANRSVLLYHNTTTGSGLIGTTATTAAQGQGNDGAKVGNTNQGGQQGGNR